MKSTKLIALIMLVAVVFTSCGGATTATKTEEKTTETIGATTSEPTEIVDGSYSIYVAVNGNDNATGTKDAPFATLAKAKEYAKTIDKSLYTGINVIFGDGEWLITETTTFDGTDSGTETCPIRYIGSANTVFTGGISFGYDKFEKIDDTFASYLNDDAKTKVVKLDLKQFGFKAEDYARMILRSLDRTDEKFGDLPVFSLYANDKRMDLSRYPNEGFITIKSFEDNGDGTYTFYYKTDDFKEHVKKWHTTEDIYLAGSFQNFYYQDYAETLSVSQRTGKVTIDPFFCEKKPVKYNEGHCFYFTNIAEEVDMPGEYYLSPDCVLYYYPIDGAETATFKYSTFEGMYAFDIEYADYISFEGITFENTSKNMFEIKGNNISFKNCTFRDIGKDAIHGFTGTNFTLDSNKFSSIGELVVEVHGGFSPTLTSENIVITNNYIDSAQETGRRSAMALCGTGMYVAHNEFYNCPRAAIDFAGPCGIFEYNYFDHCNYECDDYGVVYTCSNFMSWGTVIRYNYFNDINSTIKKYVGDDWGSWCGVHAVYLDGHTSGIEIYENVFENIGASAIVNNGGRDIEEHDNVFINCDFTYDYADWYSEALNGSSMNMQWYLDCGWAAAFPRLAEVNFEKDVTQFTEEDPKHAFMPGGTVIKDNWSYIVEGTDSDKNTRIADRAMTASDITLPEIITYAEGAQPNWKTVAAKHLPKLDVTKIGNID